ncbi:MAG: PH domain-containing protein [Alphaproteobacteria bacterium]|nr:PH domain-containing protein [Alphaproteobacteria bacterium]
MTSFIEKTLGHDERLLMYSQLHWIVPLQGFLWMLVFVLVGWGAYALFPHWLAFTIPGALGAVIFMMYLIRFITTRIGLTDRRLLLRTGLIAVNVEEIDLDDVKAQRVDHGWFGRFLGYGEIHLDARFVGDVPLPDIDRPYALLRRIHEVCSELGESAFFLGGSPPRSFGGPPSDRNLEHRTQVQYNENARPPGARPHAHKDV